MVKDMTAVDLGMPLARTSGAPDTIGRPEHSGLIADEVLATDFASGEADGGYGEPFTDEGLSLTFRLRKA